MDTKRFSADLIVVGSGVAGLSAALAAAGAGARVRLLTGGPLMAGSSPRAQGGVAAAVGADDAPALHATDTLAVGAGLNDRRAVRVLVQEGRTAVRRLLDGGVPFDGGPEHPDLGLEAGHHRRRILHAGGGATGWTLTSSLVARVVEHLNIAVHAHTPADELLGEAGAGRPWAGGDRVIGVRSAQTEFLGRAVVLATGGYAGLWGRTTNAPESRGSGLALAWLAGASLADLEFVQFHPTALCLPGRPAFLLSEALRGEGARVVDASGEQIADPLLPRDQLARAIARHLRDRGPVYLTLRHLDPDFVRGHFANIAARIVEWGLDLARDPLPIAPAAHYCMGGIRTDTHGRTDVPGLYAAGEVACTGVQGANRLASNSLLECLVFGARAARAALTGGADQAARWETEDLSPQPPPRSAEGEQGAHTGAPSVRPEGLPPLRGEGLGERLDRDLGVERTAEGLTALLADLPDSKLPAPCSRDAWLASLIARAALLREESRGAHYRADAPETKDRWRGRMHWRRQRAPRFEEVRE